MLNVFKSIKEGRNRISAYINNMVLKCSRVQNSESHSVISDSLRSHELYSPWNSPGQNTGVGSLSLLQGIFPTQGLNPFNNNLLDYYYVPDSILTIFKRECIDKSLNM